jgi:hypothetical protein
MREPPPLPDHIQCAKCNQIKPRSSFKRKATPREMQRWGKTGESGLVMTVLSKRCSQCRPRKKRPSSLGLTELLKMQKEGAEFHRMSTYQLDRLITAAKKRDVETNMERSLKLRQKHAKRIHAETVNSLDATVKKLRPRIANKKQSPEKRHYLQTLLKFALRARDFVRADISMGRYETDSEGIPKPTPKKLGDFLTPTDHKEVKQAYDAIPEAERLNMKDNGFN